MPPPIRYPLPTLIAILLLSLVSWRGAGWFRGVRAAIAARWQRAVEGPEVPSSASPQVVAGPIVRRALILRDNVPVSDRPDATPTDAIAWRMFVDVYDTWPLMGEPTHLRVGNRRPIGWVAIADALPWDSRLVVKADRLAIADRPDGTAVDVAVGGVPLPLIGHRGDSIELAIWKPDGPWSAVARRGWTKIDTIPRGSLGALLASEEIPALLSLAIGASDPEARDRVRLRAVLGRLIEPANWPASEVGQAKSALPARAFERVAGVHPSDRLAALNADARSDASWGGHAFRFVPLDDLP